MENKNIDIDVYLDWFYAKFNMPFMPQWTCMRQDHASLLTIIQKFGVKSILEIGTWQGYTGLCMWLFPGVERMLSLDICAGMGVEFNCVNHQLLPDHFYGHYLKDTPAKLCFADSTQWIPSGLRFDMVYIDANHDYEHVKQDTELAFSVADKVVAWHDYGSEPGVNKYLDETFGLHDGFFAARSGGLVMYRPAEMGLPKKEAKG